MSHNERGGWRGGWRGGGSRPGKAAWQKPKEENQGNVCWHYQTARGCYHGADCKFSHEDGRNNRGNPPPPRENPKASSLPPSTGSPDDDQQNWSQPDTSLKKWKGLFYLSKPSRKIPDKIVSQFLRQAVDLLDGEPTVVQEVFRSLASEKGLHYVRLATDEILPSVHSKKAAWESLIRPIFHIVTHANVENSALLERELAEVANFLGGPGLQRALFVYDFVVSLLGNWASHFPEAPVLPALELSVAVLTRIQDGITTSIVNPELVAVVEQLSGLLEQAVPDAGNAVHRHRAATYIAYLKQRLGMGQRLPEIDGKRRGRPKAAVATKFELRRDLPGNLSSDGRRHDNDFEDMTKISILPTYDEIMAARANYLPTNDPSQWHRPGIQGLLDRHFRLLREDTVGQLCDAIRFEMIRWEIAKEKGRTRQQQQAGPVTKSLRTFAYENAEAIDITCDKFRGLELMVAADQPAAVLKLGPQKRREWWGKTKRMQPGALVCVVGGSDSVMFCVVSECSDRNKGKNEPLPRRHRDRGTEGDGESDDAQVETTPSLAGDQNTLYVKLRPAKDDGSDVESMMAWHLECRAGAEPRYLVEFPGVLLDAFKHTLAALQNMSARPILPFIDILAPDRAVHGGDKPVDDEPPLYTRGPRWSHYDLSCLTSDNSELVHNPVEPINRETLAGVSSLDPAQAGALLDALNRSFCCIQGPPGTGKSYTGQKIIRALLANKAAGQLGPILCVCYTNHALDQLLEHLLDDGIEHILRIGSRSRSERLSPHNLKVAGDGMEKTKAERKTQWECHKRLEEHVEVVNKAIRDITHADEALVDFLEEYYPEYHRRLLGEDDEGFEKVVYDTRTAFARWIARGPERPADRPARDVHSLGDWDLEVMYRDERKALYGSWIEENQSSRMEMLRSAGAEVQETRARLQAARREVDLRCLGKADVIGVTTTGLARNVEMLRRVRCKVLVCEEAGEVLEAHLLTALLPSVEHAILIGDHQQLRPQIQNYGLQSTNPAGMQYSLDVSLFERMVNPQHPFEHKRPVSVLDLQRRMHPSISSLVRNTLYPELKDAPSTAQHPQVTGIKKRLFWLHHTHLEDDHGGDGSLAHTSRTNRFEVGMVVALASHLVRQGTYGNGDIAVLTPYLGQLLELRRALGARFEIDVNDRDMEDLAALEVEEEEKEKEEKGGKSKGGVAPASLLKKIGRTTLRNSIRAGTVDQFQGDEAKVVIISLVRSNHARRCGFLSTPNRINVLLSRARHGMYIVGNSDTCGNVGMWTKIIGMLREGDNIGDALDLQCPRHPDTQILVSEPDHFPRFSPDGGCQATCQKRLLCGHACTGPCHSDVLHHAVKCLRPCARPRNGCDHPCGRSCGEACADRCDVRLADDILLLSCGHTVMAPLCWESQDPDAIQCRANVRKAVPGCDDQVIVPCYRDVTFETFSCTAPCGKVLPCGHTCRKMCQNCRKRETGKVVTENHGACQHVCGRQSTICRHACPDVCHGEKPCKMCRRPCEVQCSHSRCTKKCREPCVPCAQEECNSHCSHSACTMPCAAPCDWIPCSKRCKFELACGHRCPSLCGEKCPDARFCQECCDDDVGSTVADLLEMKTYGEVDLEEDPCVFPPCGHFLTRSSMDGQMGMADHYTMSEEGEPVAIAPPSASLSASAVEVKTCSTCRGPLRSVARYGRIVRRALLDESVKRLVAWSKAECARLGPLLLQAGERLRDAEKPRPLAGGDQEIAVVGSRGQQMKAIFKLPLAGRYVEMKKLRSRLEQHLKNVRREEQPYQRAADLVRNARNLKKTSGTFEFEESKIQFGTILDVQLLLLRCDIKVISDLLQLLDRPAWRASALKLELRDGCLADCHGVAAEAERLLNRRQQVEGHILLAQLYTLSRLALKRPGATQTAAEPEPEPEASTDHVSPVDHLFRKALEHVETAQELMEKYPAAKALKPELDATRVMANDGSWYAPVSAEEQASIYATMAKEFRGTGHWYACANGHPFSVGECGLPMQQAKCPECGAAVGGRNHEPETGVTRATEFELMGERAKAVGEVTQTMRGLWVG